MDIWPHKSDLDQWSTEGSKSAASQTETMSFTTGRLSLRKGWNSTSIQSCSSSPAWQIVQQT